MWSLNAIRWDSLFCIAFHFTLYLCSQLLSYAATCLNNMAANLLLQVTTPLLFKLIPAVVHLGILLRWFSPETQVEVLPHPPHFLVSDDIPIFISGIQTICLQHMAIFLFSDFSWNMKLIPSSDSKGRISGQTVLSRESRWYLRISWYTKDDNIHPKL